LVRIYSRGYGNNSVESMRSNGTPVIEAAIDKWGAPGDPGWKLVEKYLRAYHGAHNIETYYSGDYWYVAYDSEDWIRSVGFDDVTAPRADYKPYDMLAEWRAWINGEVYGYVIEREVTWNTTTYWREPKSMTTWETVDSCWGYYEYDYVVSEAKAALKYEIESN
jgi:hypothetical protein